MSTLSANRLKKQEKVEAVTERVKEAEGVILANYKGLSVSALEELRAKLRNSHAKVEVVKNTLLNKVFEGVDVTFPEEVYAQPTAIITAKEDSARAAKSLAEFIKENEVVQIKGGLLEREVLTVQQVNNLASLPSKDELIGKVVAGFKSPLFQLVQNLSSPIRGLVFVLSAIKDQKQ